VEKATEMLISGLRGMEWKFRDVLECRYLVAAPGHTRGGASQAAQAICTAVEQQFTWLEWLPGALFRQNKVPQSRGSVPPERPTVQDHLESIVYSGPSLDQEPGGFLLFDDVLASGSTTSACRTLLLEQVNAERVVGIYLARVFGSFQGPLYASDDNEDAAPGR
jgi:predicted amidophosphoribosyltransferase